MNKTTLVKQKEMIVKLTIVFLLSTIVTYSQSDNDLLLEKIINEYVNDGNIIKKECNNDKVLYLLEKRKDKYYTLYGSSKKDQRKYKKMKRKKQLNDSAIYITSFTKIAKRIKKSDNNYLEYGQGNIKKAENFLDDKFILRKKRGVWENKKYKSIISSVNSNFRVSHPVYNLDKTKAIIVLDYLKEKTSVEELLFFIKKNGKWEKVFSQLDEKYWSN